MEQLADPADNTHQIASSNFCYNWFHNSFSPNCRAFAAANACLVQVDWRFTEWSRGDASDIDGQPIWARERERTSQTPYNFQTVFPPTIVRTARPFSFQPSNGELREVD